MPRVIDYLRVAERMSAGGFVSLYHRSGAFGFAAGADVRARGLIGPEDPTIRPAARALVRQVAPPFEANLAAALGQACAAIGTEAWLMPKSHWHYELHFGNRALLEAVLPAIGIDPALLRERNDGSALAFDAGEAGEAGALCETAERLLGGLAGSDFMVAWPEGQTLCTVHHHVQLWFQTTRADVIERVG